MFKKGFISCLLAAALLVTLGGAALADHEETAPARETVQEPIRDYAPGTVPAQTGAVQSMSPAVHGVLLAMLHHGADEFQADDTALAWESLYNMLSLYGQLDERSEYQDSDHLLLLSETVRDYTAALDVSFDELGPLPGSLSAPGRGPSSSPLTSWAPCPGRSATGSSMTPPPTAIRWCAATTARPSSRCTRRSRPPAGWCWRAPWSP